MIKLYHKLLGSLLFFYALCLTSIVILHFFLIFFFIALDNIFKGGYNKKKTYFID